MENSHILSTSSAELSTAEQSISERRSQNGNYEIFLTEQHWKYGIEIRGMWLKLGLWKYTVLSLFGEDM